MVEDACPATNIGDAATRLKALPPRRPRRAAVVDEMMIIGGPEDAAGAAGTGQPCVHVHAIAPLVAGVGRSWARHGNTPCDVEEPAMKNSLFMANTIALRATARISG